MMEGIDRVSPHISIEEYACPCCGKLPPSFQIYNPIDCYRILFNIFEEIRHEYGGPIRINSAYRCPRHNEDVGGGELSVHQFGLALDLDAKNPTDVGVLYEIVNRRYPDLRIGKYTDVGTFIHIDNGYMICPKGSEDWHKGARWTG